MRAASLPPNWEDLVKNSSEISTTEEYDLAETWANEIDSENEISLGQSAGPSSTKITDPFAILPDQATDGEFSQVQANSSSDTVQSSEGEKSTETSSKRLQVSLRLTRTLQLVHRQPSAPD